MTDAELVGYAAYWVGAGMLLRLALALTRSVLRPVWEVVRTIG